MKHLFALAVFFSSFVCFSQELTVEKIMRDPKWIGTAPSNISWSADSRTVYFEWNPVNAASDSAYKIQLPGTTPVKVEKPERRLLPSNDVQFSGSRTKAVFEKYGDIFLIDLLTKKTTQITNTGAYENNPSFSKDEKKIYFTTDQNLFSWEFGSGKITQHTDFRRGKKTTPTALTEQERWLRNDQLAMMQVLKEREEKKNLAEKIRKSENPDRPKEIYLDEKTVDLVRMSPDEKFVTFRLTKQVKPKNTIVPNYVTPSGFTEDISGRTKVGAALNTQELFIYDVAGDTVFHISTSELEGITDKITFTNSKESKDRKPEARQVTFTHTTWAEDGSRAAVVIRSLDNKDRWITILDPKTRKLKVIHRLHDDAWIGPFLGWSFGSHNAGWIDNQNIWFLSEETGYSHLYVADVNAGTKRALTNGKFEVQNVQLSSNRKTFYITTNEVHPGEKHFYRLPVAGGKAERLTLMTGAHEVEVSPDEKMLAFRYSASTKPWELYIMENKPGAKATQVTNSLTQEFKAYPWKEPELVTIKARDNQDIYARLYKPKNPNGAAVIFVHGAGYLQNAHKWWSSYFREYMFHNLLADQGYTVLDLDYRASSGYGRDWRTGIYQFMGGKDLTDNIDGAKYLVDQHNVDAKRIGIYGGSYGGFITLMGLFTTPDVFAAGAALRPVTDWAHYNHGYTANILNTPVMDSLAYAKSSPIYYAEGLKGALLICHGMVDVNVHFQDVVRLQQRLIELGKDNWEVAAYPMEDHAFVEPSSWTDEYKRILKLFNTNLLPKK
ncbi:MAG TPA: prolyl oligopeptidase family serine peptidase [Chryseosolibacter sp.]